MKIPFNKTWILLEREDYANYLFVSATWEFYTWLPKKFGFIPGRFLGAEYINSTCNLFCEKSSFDQYNKKHFQMLFTKPQAWDNLHKITIKNAKSLFTLGRRIRKLNPRRLTDKQLVSRIDQFQKAQTLVHDPRGPMFLLETPDNLVTNYLLNCLREKYQASSRPLLHPNEAFQTLITSLQKSIWSLECQELAKIALLKSKKERQKWLIAHSRKYEWLEYGLQGKILTLEHFEQELKKIPKAEAIKLASHSEKLIADTKAKQLRLIKEYDIHPIHQKIFRIVQDSLYTRLLSKDSQFFGYYCMEPILREFGCRTGLSLEQVRFLHYRDFKKVLLGKQDFSRLTTERQKYSLFICDKGETISYVGRAAKKIRKKLNFYKTSKTAKLIESLRGQPAYKGLAKGRVKIINTIQEMVKMHVGNILVSHMTNPGIVPAMKQAAAIVTDLGGITCHAAIVARELKKPCIIGTKFATRVFKDGDLVEVDANKGIVRKIK